MSSKNLQKLKQLHKKFTQKQKENLTRSKSNLLNNFDEKLY